MGPRRRWNAWMFLLRHWISWTGYPKHLVTDRGLNDRGVLAKDLSAAGAKIWEQSDWKRPKHFGHIELNGDVGKRVAAMIIESKEINVKV